MAASEFDSILENPFTARARVVADSVSPGGVRLISVEEVFWRPVLAERNTHKNQYGNSASSRAIPVEKTLRKFMDEPAYPTSWPAEQPGMQGGAELSGQNLEDALRLWRDVQEYIGNSISDYLTDHPDKSTRLHKSVLNRLMEFGQWHTRITTATAWDNFLIQRCDPMAQPEIQDVALLIRQAIKHSTPRPVGHGEYHLPYISDDAQACHDIAAMVPGGQEALPEYYSRLANASAARCARTSYETQAGHRDVKEDLSLFDRLITQQMAKGDVVHWSPTEHVATPDPDNRQREPLRWFGPHGEWIEFDTTHLPKVGALVGWRNLRTTLEQQHGVVTFR